MFLANVVIASSAAHGLGVFAAEDIPAGTVVYQHVPPEFFQSYSEKQFQRLSPETQRFILHYGFWNEGRYHIHLDDIRFLNDSTSPNLCFQQGAGIIALRDIVVGEELTQDYSDIADPDWLRVKRAGY